jgi:hypothetical protein
MSDEQPQKRHRTPNPFTTYKKAKAAADKARRLAAKAAELREKAEAAAVKAEQAAADLPELEAAEQAAYDALQAALADLDTDTDDVEEYDEDESE